MVSGSASALAAKRLFCCAGEKTINGGIYMKNQLVKSLVILVLMLGLLVPVQIVKSMVGERKLRQQEVFDQVSARWGSPLVFGGLYLSADKKRMIAETADINCELKTEVRRKGIFKVPCFSSLITVDAVFNNSLISDEYALGLALSHNGQLDIESVFVNGKALEVQKKNINCGMFQPNYDFGRIKPQGDQTRCTVRFRIRGSERISFANQAAATQIRLAADWADPNFIGNLPDERELSQKGFSAQWHAANGDIFLSESDPAKSGGDTFGVSFFVQQSVYQQTDRVLKYALLFIFLTFALFFIFEHVYSLRIHPMQYLMVGAALTLFYMLLLALSEHIVFSLSYFAASAAVVLLIASYCRSVLNEKVRALLIGLFLAVLYVFLYILVQMQEFSLLLGSIGIFVLLASAMYFTRKIDWYALQQGPASK